MTDEQYLALADRCAASIYVSKSGSVVTASQLGANAFGQLADPSVLYECLTTLERRIIRMEEALRRAGIEVRERK